MVNSFWDPNLSLSLKWTSWSL